MNYNSFLRLPSELKAYNTFTFGIFAGADEQGGDVYQLNDFWVTVRENTKGFYFEARHNQPPELTPAKMTKIQA